ncbi:MAG: GUN4 domain-containing protein [Snowella sp.]|nr:GUN4 domain-containing protein [Snowella sp.]
MSEQQFDVFLAHNSNDKPQVEAIAQELKRHGLNVWLDKEQLHVGDSVPRKVQQGLIQSRNFAFFIGLEGFGKFQDFWELDAMIMLASKNDLRIIPVLLPGVSELPKEQAFLASRLYLQFQHSVDEAEPLDQLVRAIKVTTNSGNNRITGIKSQSISDSSTVANNSTLPPEFIQPREDTECDAATFESQQQQQELTINQQPSQETPPDRETEDRIREEIEDQQLVTTANQPPQTAESVSPSQSDSPPQTEQDDLSSERFGDNYYAKLRDLLAAKDWEAANRETDQRMREVRKSMREDSDIIIRDSEILKNFPCLDLRNIDRLWVKYSQGKFGFTVQKEIWEGCGSPTSYTQEWIDFTDVIGWRTFSWFGPGNIRESNQLTYDLALAKKGHLPTSLIKPFAEGVMGDPGAVLYFIVSRLSDCKILSG